MKTLFPLTIALAPIAAIAAAGLTAAPASAQVGAPHRIAVSHADLDLGTAEGRAALDLRVLHAARAACGTPSPADPRGRADVDACVAEARAAAAAQRDAAVALAQRRAQSVLASSR